MKPQIAPHRRQYFATAFFVVSFFYTTHAFADSHPYAHEDFFLRLSVGPGYSSLSINDASDTTVKGGSLATNIAIGGAVARNLIIHGTLHGIGLPDPDVELNGSSIDPGDPSLNIYGLGAGATYYFMPSNIYISGSLLLARGDFDSTFSERKSDIGFGLNALVGKEWWVNPSWGMGVAGMFDIGRLTDEGDSSTHFAFHILFSVTYN